MRFDGVQAVLFDMDGTLIDSEQYTEGAAQRLLDAHGLSSDGVDLMALYGITWDAAADHIQSVHPSLSEVDVSGELEAHFSALSEAHGVALVPQSDVFFQACADRLASPGRVCTS